MTTPSPLIQAAELLALTRADRPDLRIVDCRWVLGQPGAGEIGYAAGHLPGAIHLDLDHDLSDPHGYGAPGRHPLPSPAAVAATLGLAGIGDRDLVVAYDDVGGWVAARLWWMLDVLGHDAVRVLDGGLAAWTAAGLPVATDDVVPEPGTIALTPGGLPATDIDGAAGWPDHGVLIDVRAPERFRGDAEPIDPRAGHVPGAVNVPTGGNIDADGTFLAPEALRERFAAVGVEPGAEVAVYCGSGVTASHTVLALRLAGIDAALFPGSWSQWSQHPDRPVATGP